MTRNDTFYKILFAIEIALLPLTMAIYYLFPNSQWIVGLLVGGVLIVKIWREIFKQKDNFAHLIINSVANVITISTLVIFFTVVGDISLALCISVVALAVVFNLFKVLMHKVTFPEMINAVDTCFMLFECLLLATLTFVLFNILLTNIALFTLILTSGVSVAYKVYHAMRYQGVWVKLRNLFRRK